MLSKLEFNNSPSPIHVSPSLWDIYVKLHLDSEEDAEYIVGKAIQDGVIEGHIVHEKGWMESGMQKSGYGPEVSEIFRRSGFAQSKHKGGVFFLHPFAFILTWVSD